MNGKILMSVCGVGLVLFTGGMWYAQTYAFYAETQADTIQVADATIPVSDWRGIDADTSPNKLRACFTADPAAFADLPIAPPAPASDGRAQRATPEALLAPAWFDCFDAIALSDDLEAGRATAYLASDETPEGATDYLIHKIVAVYPDGRAYLWRHYRED